MHSTVLKLFIIATILISTITFGQSFFGGGTKNATGSPSSAKSTPGMAQPNPVISPKDFASLVNSIDQQTKASLAQEYQQQISKQKPLTPSVGGGSGGSGGGGTAPPPPVNRPPATGGGASTAPTTPPPTSVPPSSGPPPSVPPPSEGPSEIPSQPYSGPQLPPAPPPTPAQSEVYTGFGSGSQVQPTPPPAGGGWNIRY